MKIEQTHLRIGNKLQKDNGEVFTVLSLDNRDGEDILVEEQRGFLTLNYNLYGIPITEEWLDKFNFMKLDNERYRTYKNYLIKKINDVWFWCYISYPDDVHVLDEIKFVHQLQNKVFINTKQELEIVKSETTK